MKSSKVSSGRRGQSPKTSYKQFYQKKKEARKSVVENKVQLSMNIAKNFSNCIREVTGKMMYAMV